MDIIAIYFNKPEVTIICPECKNFILGNQKSFLYDVTI